MFISSPLNRSTDLGGRDAMFHKGIEDIKRNNYQDVDSGTQIQSLYFNHYVVLTCIFLFLVASELF